MRVVVDADATVTHEGAGVDLREPDIAPDTVLAVVRGERADDPDLTLDCHPSTAPHDVLGHVDGSLQSSLRVWLAEAARSRGREPPQQAAYERVQAELADCSVPDVDVTAARRRVAEAGAEEARLREELATLRGRLQARRETGAATEAVTSDLTATATRLSEVETERVAAEQTLRQREAAAREARAVRERRLELVDRADNLEREMRAALAATLASEFAEAVDAVASSNRFHLPGDEATPAVTADGNVVTYDGPDVLAQLAAVRIAALDAPVVVSADVVDTGAGTTAATHVADLLETPTLLL